MNQFPLPNVIRGVKRLLLWQLLTCLLAALVFGLIGGRFSGVSAFLGGMVCLIANSYFAWRSFRMSGASRAREILASVYFAEFMKILISVFLFILIFKTVHVKMLPFFLGYILAQSVFWLSPFIF